MLIDEGSEFIKSANTIRRALKSISQIRQPVKRIEFKVLSLKYGFPEASFENCAINILQKNMRYHPFIRMSTAQKISKG